ncbi:putative prolyl-tRNA synthetase [Danaus plexippus plexippus]|uniref:proline--tRNA ligase n=1 Tax=Danaus plexippus plexippus TaxID=278856 RepID=A0A212EIR1_DANPL|nr:putative prolyl-tRNA synthetase [Danaus plexippus plexippus]
MKLLSKIFQPVITIPKGAKIKNTEITCKSQKLLLECGLVRPTSTGFFTLLPLARRALTKLENIVHRCLEDVGAQQISLPCLTSSRLWEASGRLDRVGSELLKVEDRHNKKYILSPTHEEAIADLLSDVAPLSHKQLPFILYQIGNKYRDELRPKHGLLRSREFLMMDAYSVHTDTDSALCTYDTLTHAYRNVFRELRLPVRRVEAPSGDMGGTLSHEWQLPAPSGEDCLSVCPSCSHTTLLEEGKEGRKCVACGRETEICSSIEVGHTFVLGDRYSAPIVMACYGIGLTRLLAASVELLSSERSLRWPHALAPYKAIVIGPKEGSKEWVHHDSPRLEQLGAQVEAVAGDVVLDDRHHLTIGKRLLQADKTGYPYIIVCGRSALESPPRYELHRDQGEVLTLPLNELLAFIKDDNKERDLKFKRESEYI